MLFLQLQRHVFVRVQTREIAKNLDNTTENSCYSKKGKTKQIRNNIKKIWLNLNHSTASMAVFFIYICVSVSIVSGVYFVQMGSTLHTNLQCIVISNIFFSLYAQRKSHNNTCDAVEKWTFQVNGNVKKWHGSSGFGFIDGFCCSVFGVLFFWPKISRVRKTEIKICWNKSTYLVGYLFNGNTYKYISII